MNKELLLIEDFMKDIDWHNTNIKTSIDDGIEPTFKNFIKWLRHEII